MKKIRYRYLVLFALLAAAVAGFVVFRTVAPLGVPVAAPAGKTDITVFGLGTIEARVVSTVGFEVSGTLTRLDADHGDAVAKGDVLAQLDDGEQAARVARAEAGVESAVAAVKAAESVVAKARAVLVQRQQSDSRIQTLFARQTVSAETADEARMQKKSAEAELGVALSNVDVARAGLGEARAQDRFDRIVLDQHVLYAPYDAMVFERSKELGAVVAPGEPVFALVDPDTVWLLAYVDEASAGDVRVGQPARIKLRSLPQREFTGHVMRIGIESDRVSEERRVYVGCDDCPPNFHLGEQAEVLITIASLEGALFAPESAVEAYDGHHGKVWTVEQGRLHLRPVTFGHKTLDARLQIAEGLPADARVVTARVKGIREGRRATIIEVAERVPQ